MSKLWPDSTLDELPQFRGPQPCRLTLDMIHQLLEKGVPRCLLPGRQTGGQSGRTTRQIKEAPQGSVFVWPNNQLGYPQRLAASLGRRDIRFVSMKYAEDNQSELMMNRSVIIDHGALSRGFSLEIAMTYERNRKRHYRS